MAELTITYRKVSDLAPRPTNPRVELSYELCSVLIHMYSKAQNGREVHNQNSVIT